jgi:hypothetical protein
MRVKRSVSGKLSQAQQAAMVIHVNFEPPAETRPKPDSAGDRMYPDLLDLHFLLDKARREGYASSGKSIGGDNHERTHGRKS